MFIKNLEALLVKPSELFKDEIETISDDGEIVIQPIKCEDFNEIVTKLKTRLSITQSVEDTLAMIMSVVVSTPLPGNALWLHVIGPPSSGKTTIIELFDAARAYVVPRSTFTGLVSGFKKPRNTDNDDAVSPIEMYNGKTIMVKDLTPLLTQSEAQKQKVFGQLRDAYDRSIRVDFLNDERAHFESVNFSMVTGVTDVVRTMDDSLLGARFICCEYMDAEYESHIGDHLDKAIANAIQDATTFFNDGSNNGKSSNTANSIIDNIVPSSGIIDGRETIGYDIEFEEEENKVKESELEIFNKEIRGMVYGFLEYKSKAWNTVKIPEFDDKTKLRLAALSALFVKLRTKVERDNKGRTLQKVRSELPMRLSTQLSKLHVVLTYVLSLPVNSVRVHRIVTKAAVDTINPHGHRWQVLSSMMKPETGDLPTGINIQDLQKRCETNLESIAQVLADFDELNLLDITKPANARNANHWLYTIKDEYKLMWKLIFGE